MSGDVQIVNVPVPVLANGLGRCHGQTISLLAAREPILRRAASMAAA
jgi:hypothetical protein